MHNNTIDGHPSVLVTILTPTPDTAVRQRVCSRFSPEKFNTQLVLINYQTFAASQLGKCLTSRVSSTNFIQKIFIRFFAIFSPLKRDKSLVETCFWEFCNIFSFTEMRKGLNMNGMFANVLKIQAVVMATFTGTFLLFTQQNHFFEKNFSIILRKYRFQVTCSIFVKSWRTSWGSIVARLRFHLAKSDTRRRAGWSCF